MTDNNQILNNLIGAGQGQNQTVSPNAVPTGTDDEVLITTARVVSTRNKIYLVGVAILAFIVGYSFLMPSWDTIQQKNTELSNLDMQIENLEKKHMQYQTNRVLVDTIMQEDSGIVLCLNEGESCNELPDVLKDNDNFSIARSYILLGDMEDEKMEVNEKKIIKNLDTFLLKDMGLIKSEELIINNEEGTINNEENEDNEENEGSENNINNENNELSSLEEEKQKILEQLEKEKQNERSLNPGDVNGAVKKIIIGDKQRFNDTLYYVPIELSITFDDKDGLLSFIDNVEKRVPEDKDQRLLYKISKITYDIVNYDEPQDTTINMYLYYYEK